MNDTTLRPATFADKVALFEMHVMLFRDHIDQIWGWDDEWQIANFEKEWEDASTEIIEVRNQRCGCIQTRRESDHIYVSNLALYPENQNQGLGAVMINLLKERAVTAGLPIRLSVFKTNQRAIAFYERLGFEIVETTDTGWKMCWLAQLRSGAPTEMRPVVGVVELSGEMV